MQLIGQTAKTGATAVEPDPVTAVTVVGNIFLLHLKLYNLPKNFKK
jgi:hypothetical protein